MKGVIIIVIGIIPRLILGGITIPSEDKEEKRTDFLVDLISFNLKSSSWTNILCVGQNLPESFYTKSKGFDLTFNVVKPGANDHFIEDVMPYYSNVIVLNCMDFDDFEESFKNAMSSPYWHPQAHLILYYNVKDRDDIAKIFMIFWFYYACNAIVVQYDDAQENMLISYYNPFITEKYRLPYEFGCWKTKKLGRPVEKLSDSFTCEEGCHNVTLHSKLRALHLGTCIGIKTHAVRYDDRDTLHKLKLFEDKGRDLHGMVLRGHAVEVLPFLKIEEESNGSYSLQSRDGMVWNVVSKLMNFSIDLFSSKDEIKMPFNFEINIQQIYKFSQKQADLLIFPVYQFDIIIMEVDMTVAYVDSGVCILSHRADFETVLFDTKLIQNNARLVARFICCFFCIWLTFFIFNIAENGRPSFDQAGKDLVNTIRNVLSISLFHPPSRDSFRIYLFVSLWCFFAINFATQAAIISFFTAYKRGKQVDTFEDVLDKGYPVEGMASPDMMLPDTEERFRNFNSMFQPISDLYGCVDSMSKDSRRFCLIDCAVGRYVARNRLNDKGEQYLHIARKDRIHSYYLNMLLHKHSPLKKTFNKWMRKFIEAGLIKKWEQYRFSELKEDSLIKPLSLEDLAGIFKCYFLFQGLSTFVFLLEVIIGFLRRLKIYLNEKIVKWRRTRDVRKRLKLEIERVHTFVQTI